MRGTRFRFKAQSCDKIGLRFIRRRDAWYSTRKNIRDRISDTARAFLRIGLKRDFGRQRRRDLVGRADQLGAEISAAQRANGRAAAQIVEGGIAVTDLRKDVRIGTCQRNEKVIGRPAMTIGIIAGARKAAQFTEACLRADVSCQGAMKDQLVLLQAVAEPARCPGQFRLPARGDADTRIGQGVEILAVAFT